MISDAVKCIEKVNNVLLITLASKIYSYGMVRREIELKEYAKKRRDNDKTVTFQEWRKYREGR